jgi:hypothetical protein
MNEDNTNQDKIQQLSDILQQLNISQQTINRQIREAQQLVNEINENKPSKRDINNIQDNKRLDEGTRVRILKPKKHQSTYGVISGYTLTGYARILGDNGDIIRRKPTNIEQVQE